MPVKKDLGSDSAGIPVGKDGIVPEWALQKRYEEWCDERDTAAKVKAMMAVKYGRVPGPPPNTRRKDYNNTSDHIIPLRCTPEQVAPWWQDPSSCDVQDIDCRGPPKLNVPHNMTSDQRQALGRIKVVGTPAEELKVRRTLVSTYIPVDLKTLADGRPTIVVNPEPTGRSGAYYPQRREITLDRRDGVDRGTITHEGGHCLRDTDPSRKGVLVKRNKNIAVEESCTVAEQMARCDKPDYTGYYQHVAVYDKKKHVWRNATAQQARRMAEEDHRLFTAGRGKGLKGTDAIESVERNWSKSHIARLRYRSNKMAINILADQNESFEKLSMAKTLRSSSGTVTVTPGRQAAAANRTQKKGVKR